MSLTDPINNFIICIKNAANAQKETVDIPASKMGAKILEICKFEGYIEDFRILKDNKQGVLKVYLKYGKGKKSAIMGMKKISKPGLRIYTAADKLPRVLNGLGIAVISTSRGVMTDKEARKNRIGGEVICHVW